MTNSGMVLLPDEMLHPKLLPNELTFSFQLPTNPSFQPRFTSLMHFVSLMKLWIV